MIGALEIAIGPLIVRRRLDPNLLTPYLSRIEAVRSPGYSHWGADFAHDVRRTTTLYNLSERDREALYRSSLGNGKPNLEYHLTWQTAALRALDERLDSLVGEIEVAIASHKPTDSAGASLVADLQPVDLPLAHARLTADWVNEYMKHIQNCTDEQALSHNDDPDSWQDRLVHDALQDLVWSGQRQLVPQLKTVWRSIKEPEYEAAAKREEWARLVQLGKADSDYPRGGVLALDLGRAIRALGEPSFQAKNLHLDDVRQKLEARLVNAGKMAPRHSHQE
jgi:hypothetical protein